MPVPQFMTVPAYQVRTTDDILIDRATKEATASGEPFAIDYIDAGTKWVYINVKTPIGRKRAWRFDLYADQVDIVRMVKTDADMRLEAADRIRTVAFRDLKKYWQVRNQIAEALRDGVMLKKGSLYSYTFRSREDRFEPIGRYDQLDSRLESMKTLEASVDLWRQVEELTLRGKDHVDALAEVLEDVKGWLIKGQSQVGDNLLRRFLRDHEHLINVEPTPAR